MNLTLNEKLRLMRELREEPMTVSIGDFLTEAPWVGQPTPQPVEDSIVTEDRTEFVLLEAPKAAIPPLGERDPDTTPGGPAHRETLPIEGEPIPVSPIRPAAFLPDEDLVTELRRLLSEAEAGDIRGMAFITIDRDRSYQYGISGAEAKSNKHRVYFLLDVFKEAVRVSIVTPVEPLRP